MHREKDKNIHFLKGGALIYAELCTLLQKGLERGKGKAENMKIRADNREIESDRKDSTRGAGGRF